MNKNTYKVIPHALAATALFAVGTSIVSAAEITTYVPLTSIPGLFTKDVATNPVSIVKGLYGLAIGAGSVIAVVMIVLAGFKYMYEESISGKSGAKEQIENAFLGLLVILGSYILLRTVNADLVNFNPVLPGGTGGVSGLVESSEQYATAQANIRAAQASVNQINTAVASLDSQISTLQADLNSSDDVDSSDPRWETLTRLQTERDTKSAQAAYITGTALADHGAAVVEAYLNSPNAVSVTNAEAYFKSGKDSLDAAETKLTALYNKTKDPAVAKQIVDVQTKKFVLSNFEEPQLNRLQQYQNKTGWTGSLLNSTNAAVEDLKKTRDSAVYTLQHLPDNNDATIAKIQAETAQRIKMICPKCN